MLPGILGLAASSFLGPRSWVPTGPWVSTATAGARPRGGQPEWGRGAPGACAAVSPCSPLWPPCSPSRCPPRCPGETRVKYSQVAPPAPLPGSTLFSLGLVRARPRPPGFRLPNPLVPSVPGAEPARSFVGGHSPTRPLPHIVSQGPSFAFPSLSVHMLGYCLRVVFPTKGTRSGVSRDHGSIWCRETGANRCPVSCLLSGGTLLLAVKGQCDGKGVASGSFFS